MQNGLIFGLTAIAATVPVLAYSWRSNLRRTALLWLLLVLACAGPASAVIARAHAGWLADFATSIWVIIAATMAVFIATAATVKSTWRLTPLLSAYMLLLSIIGLAWQNVPGDPVDPESAGGWLIVHILLAVTTYAFATLAAVAALSAFIQEHALKRKQRPMLEGVLPSVTDCDRLIQRFLMLGEGILGLGLLTGVAVNISAHHPLLAADHKTVFTLGAFIIIGAILYLQARHGLRGRRAARGALVAYLLLTLGYPGVKFVSDVLLR